MKDLVAVIGAGTMGPQIALLAAVFGYPVKLYNRREPEKGLAKAARLLKLYQRSNSALAGKGQEILDRIQPVDTLQNLKEATIVIESIAEDLTLKQQLFKELDAVCGADALFATNTSSLDVAKIAEGTRRPDRVLGLHFLNPVIEMNLVEIVYTPATSPAPIERATHFVQSLEKTPMPVPESIVNRLLMPMINEACHVLEQKWVSALEVDRSMQLGAHHRMGPLSLADLIGIDIVVAILESFQKKWGDRYRPAPALRAMMEKGWLGRKTGQGFFRYNARKT